MKKLKNDKEKKAFKNLLDPHEELEITKEDGEIILNVLEREKKFIKNESDLNYINGSINCLKDDNCIIDGWSRADLRVALNTIFKEDCI